MLSQNQVNTGYNGYQLILSLPESSRFYNNALHPIAIGELYSWGMGTNGNLGTGDVKDVDEPVLVKGKQLEGKTVVRVSGGGQHTLILATTRPIKDKTAG